MPAVDPSLAAIAREVVWWQEPEETLADSDDFLCRVMGRGFWEDIQTVERVFGADALRDALRHCRPGAMDNRSWNYWHHRLRVEPVPDMPRRTFA